MLAEDRESEYTPSPDLNRFRPAPLFGGQDNGRVLRGVCMRLGPHFPALANLLVVGRLDEWSPTLSIWVS